MNKSYPALKYRGWAAYLIKCLPISVILHFIFVHSKRSAQSSPSHEALGGFFAD